MITKPNTNPTTRTAEDIAAEFNVPTEDIDRWEARGILNVSVIGGRKFYLVDDICDALPKLSNLGPGMKRHGGWFRTDGNANHAYKRAIDGAAERQKLTPEEVSRRAGKKGIKVAVSITVTPEVRQAIQRPVNGGVRIKGDRKKHWEPGTILENYIARQLLKRVSRATGSSLKKLYSSKSDFDSLIQSSVGDLMRDVFQYYEIVAVDYPGRTINLPANVTYSLANSRAFTNGLARDIANKMF